MALLEKYQNRQVGHTIIAIQFFGVSAVAADGTPTYASVTDYITFWRDVTVDYDTQVNDLAPSSQLGSGNEVVRDDYTLTLSGYCKDLTGTTTAVPRPLIQAILLYDKFKILETAGGVTSTYWVVRGPGSDAFDLRQRVEQIRFRRADVGAAQVNPLVASVI